MKTRNSFFKMTLIIATVTMMVLLTTQFSVGQDWYNTSWQYRRAVTVTNPGATTLTNHQVKIILNSSSIFNNAKDDGSDIRLTASDGLTLIPFWIEDWSKTGVLATVWVKVPDIPASGTTTVYLYYGNSVATSASNGLSTFRFFDDFESWNSTPPPIAWADKAPLPALKADPTAAVCNGKLYLIGGYAVGPNTPQNTNYEYDPATNVWTVKASMPTARWGMVAVEFNGLIYVFGGANNGGAGNIVKNEVYNPVSDSWTTKADIPEGLARQGVMGVKFGTKIHLFYMDVHYEYDPDEDSYTLKTPLPYPRMWGTCAVVGSKIYIIAGGSTINVLNDENQEYSPATDSWAIKAPLPVNLGGVTRENPVINGKIYVTHGKDESAFYASNYVYDPVTDIWEQKEPAVHPRDGVGCGVINNKLYVIGGRADLVGPYGLVYNEVYDPTLDTWTPQPGPSLWNTSGTSFVSAGAEAKYQGNYGLVVQQSANVPAQRYAQSLAGFGDVYALDLWWNVTDAGGWSTDPRPQGWIFLSDNDSYGSVYFYNKDNVPVVHWVQSSGNTILQESTFNSWHKATFIRDGNNSKVVFDGTEYNVVCSPGGASRIILGVYFTTKEYFDNVRVRKWAGADPATEVLGEQSQGPPIFITTDLITDVSCFGGSNGAIDISVSGGTAPYNYSYVWTASSGGEVPDGQANNQDLTGLVAGTYSVTVTDQYISAASQSFTVTQPTAVVVSATHTEIMCTGGTSILTVSASGGTPGNPAYTYSINGIDYQASPDFTVFAGPYTVYAKDSKGCTGNVSGTIGTPAAWYDENWQYRRPVTITNPGGTILTDYQVLISLNSSFNFTKAKSDGGDIRITSTDGNTMIPFWIETWNPPTSAVIWTKVSNIPPGATTLYLYYGNNDATSASNGSTTFRFFDDFESWLPGMTGWQDKAPMPTAIADLTTAAYNGKLYSFGGYGNGPGNPLNKNYEYDPATNIWTEKTPMPTARWGMAAVEFDGLIYVFGGSISSGAGNIAKNEVYNPLSNSWTSKTDIPSALARQGLMGVKFGNKIHLFYESYHYEYDPATDAYTPKENVPIPRMWCTSAVVGSKIYLIGGHHAGSAYNENQEYDPATDNWAIKAPLPISLWGTTRDNPVINGKIYVTHGLDGSAFHTNNYVYDPATNTWEQKGPAAHPRDGVGCGVVNNKLYVIGGRADFSGPYGLVYNEVYDPLLDNWTPQPGPSLWTTSGTSYVFADASAKYQGNYGLVVRQTTDVATQRYAQSIEGFGSVYALDFNWQITDIGGIGSQPKPQGLLTLTETDLAGSLFFYNSGSVPVVRWFNGSGFNHLQNSTWNNWHKVTVVRNGFDSRVIFDETQYQSPQITSPPLTGIGKIKFGVYWATTQYLDNVRVRKWTTQEPSFILGSEISHLKASETHTAIMCYGENSTVTITATGGTAPYTGTGTFSQPAGTVVYTVSDSKGCTSEVSVTITQPEASPVGGIIQYYNSSPVNLNVVKVELYQGDTKIYPHAGDPDVITNSSGVFSFGNVCPGTYNVVVSTSGDVGGINVTDAAQTNYWGVFFGGIQKVRFYAGDVYMNNYIDGNDASRILQYFLTQGSSGWAGRSEWTFWNAEQYISENPPASATLVIPSITVPPSGGTTPLNLYGLVTGDFNQSFVPGSMKAGSESLTLIYGETISVVPDMEFDLPLSVAKDMEVGAVSLIMNFPSDLLEVNGVFLSDDPDNPLMHSLSGDELRIGWNSLEPISLMEGESLLTLKVKLIGLPGEEGIHLKLAADPLNELADEEYNVINDAVLSIDVITTFMTGTGEISLSDRLTLANHPNPFTGKTNFAYSLPVDGKVTLEIYDIVGNKVKSLVDVTQSAGNYVLSLDDAALQPGVYTATIKLDSNGNLMMRTIKIISKQ